MVTIVLGELVDGTLRRPGATLAGALLTVTILALFALGSGSHLPVLGSVAEPGDRAAEEAVELVFVVKGGEPVDSPAYRTTLEVLTAGLESDPDVAQIRRGPVGEDGQTTALGIVLAGGSAIDREQAAERLASDLDPGELQMLAGGEAAVADEVRERIEGEWPLAALALLGAIAFLLLLAGGWRLAIAGAIASTAGTAGAVALLRVVSSGVELSAAGISTAVVVGAMVGVEATVTLQLRIRRRARGRDLNAAVREAVAGAGSRLAAAAVAGVAASLCLLVVDLPAARSVAVAGAGAAAVATVAALVSLPALLQLSPPGWEGRGGLRHRRRGGPMPRRLLAAMLVVVGLAAMAALAYPALDSDPVALDATELEEPSAADEAYDLARAQFPEPFGAGLGAAFAPLVPDDVIPRLGVALGLAALLVALAALRLSRSPLSAIALGLTAALPAAATTGLFELLWRRPNAAVMLCAAGTILAVSAVRSASAAGLLAHASRGRRRGRRISRATIAPATLASIAGVLACGGLAWVLFPPLDALAVVLAAGLAVDLVVVRWIVVPALARARLRRAVT